MEKPGQNNTNPDLAQTQELAKQLARAIMGKDDYTRAEYVGVVYRSGGELKVTTLSTQGSHFKAPLGLAIAEAGGADNVVAVVHNHPKKNAESQFDPSAALKLDEFPSSRPGKKDNPGDWDNAQKLFGERTDVTYYLLDPNDKLRRYDYADREKWIREVAPPNSIEAPRGGKSYHPAPAIDLQPVLPASHPQSDPGLSDPHAAKLQAQARDAVATMESGLGVAWSRDSERIAACIGRVAYERGFEGIVSVGLNRAGEHQPAGELLCVQGRSSNPDPYANRATLPVREAANTPVEESLRRIETARAPTQEPATADLAQRQSAPSR
ncbi:XVIPCD domain-containing protein [Lysobacter enzymogenes]|uniref:XVIPCD domain-containing protein n=1 Tax=Lysobacter enzymogenes TaxID=69 RepID=UPI0038515620